MRTLIAPALVLLPLGAHAQAVPASPADEIVRIAGIAGLSDVRPGEVVASEGKILAKGLTGTVRSRSQDGVGVPVTIAGFAAEGTRREGGDTLVPLLNLEGIEYGDLRIDRVAVTDMRSAGDSGPARYAAIQAQGLRGKLGEPGSAYSVAGLRITAGGWKAGTPSKVGLNVRGISLEGPALDQAVRNFPEMPRSVDLDVGTTLDPSSSSLVLDEFTIWAGKAAALQANASFSGVSLASPAPEKATAAPVRSPAAQPEGIVPPTGRAIQAMATSRIDGAVIRLTDLGFARSLVAARARAGAIAPDAVVDDLVRQASGFMAMRLPPALLADLVGALRTFLADPRNLTVTLAPDPARNGIAQLILNLATGRVPAKSLGVSVTANDH
jgi:hypothetical protein